MTEIPKAYEPQSVEDKWYDFWLKHDRFRADPARVSARRPAYSIVIPPPNVTGVLHMGHVLNNTIQDVLARKARMDGREVLWLPGTDHAGIGTQTVVERELIRQGVMKRRDELGRDKFLEHAWAWKEKHGGIIIQQLRKLGCSCDWSRERFTMEPAYSRCVQKVFVELYRKGLIYRGRRMVNWDPAAQTALSDEEVEMKEERGHLWHIKYPLLDETGSAQANSFVIVATTRPETMLGDEAVAVNPHDPRYQHWVGRRCLLPLQNKPIPIIADELVDPKFGTGCVKVTPAHDPADYEMALRHNLPVTIVIGTDGNMTAAAGEDFVGLDRMEARHAVVEELGEIGLLVRTEDYVHHVGYSQRSHVPIEPYLSEQWFLKYPSVDRARTCVEQEDAGGRVPRAEPAVGPERSGTEPEAVAGPDRMRFHPQRWAKVYDHWMSNIKDWCISRQLWWGHRIPVRYRKGAQISESARIRGPGLADSEVRAPDIWCDVVPPPNGEDWIQDPDVLDTWFSSWLWPFATMGWTGDHQQDTRNATLHAFYPTSDLVTGPDIIFFWVARMIMAGFEFIGELPFRDVYFTGIIRDKQGRKMSKSLGNSPDPLALINTYGADALRFGTMRSAPLGQDVLFDEKDVELGRNFCNKLWNACRFRQLQQGEVQGEIDPARLTSDDRWILCRLDRAICEINAAFAEYRFNDVTQTLHRFFWGEYCDWYVEASKAALGSAGYQPAAAGNLPAADGQLARQSDPRSAGFPSANAAGQPVEGTGSQPSAAASRSSSGGRLPTVRQGAGSGADARPALRANKLAVIDFVLSHTLRLFHPFLPFITEELWHGLGYSKDMPEDQGGMTIMSAPWPRPLSVQEKETWSLDDSAESFTVAKFELVTLGRNLKAQFNLPANKRVRFVLRPTGPADRLKQDGADAEGSPAGSAGPSVAAETETLRILLNAEDLVLAEADWKPVTGTPVVANSLGELYLPLAGLIDFGVERTRLGKELEKVRAEIAKVHDKLNNPSFTQRVPAHVLAEHQQRLAQWQAKERQVLGALADLPQKE